MCRIVSYPLDSGGTVPSSSRKVKTIGAGRKGYLLIMLLAASSSLLLAPVVWAAEGMETSSRRKVTDDVSLFLHCALLQPTL